MESKLYVGNLSYNVTEKELRELFAQAGEVRAVTLVTDQYTRQPKGFGFIEMTSQTEVEKAVRMFNDQEVDGRRIIVNIARPREERTGGYRGGGDNRSGGRRRN